MAFAAGHLNLLLVCGGPGVGKSRCVRDAVGDRARWIDGNATAFGVYLEAFEARDESIVLDDVDGLYGDRAGIRLLKALCQSDAVKSVGWHIDSAALARRHVPRHFTTSSHVAIIMNQLRTNNVDVAAIEDRGHFIFFDPPPDEVHRHAAGWFWDQEVFNFVAEHLHLMPRHSLRTYVLGWEQKRAGLDWQSAVLSRALIGVDLAVARLKADQSYRSEEDRASAFVRAGEGCRATYFNHARSLRSLKTVPAIRLTHSSPPTDQMPVPREAVAKEVDDPLHALNS